jgi:antirestriction protein ArdC
MTMTKTTTTKTERRDRVAETMAATTAAIVASIEQGLADPKDWQAPWHQMTKGLPLNVATGKTYNGGNLWNLWTMTEIAGCSRYWGTFNQWRDLSTVDAPVTVRKGETAAAYILRPRTGKAVDEKTGTETTKVYGFAAHAVFHAGQVDGWTEPNAPQATEHDDADRDDIDGCYRWLALAGIRVDESHTAGASYSPTFDKVTMPERTRWTSAHGCWSTAAHEATHWTGHESRLARTFGKRFGDDAYAAEELCAELGAAFTLAALGRSTEPRPDHAQYLAHWLRILKADPAALWTVAGKASKAAELLIERSERELLDAQSAMA